LLEATAYGLAHIAQSLADLGIRIDVLVCGGSPAHSRLWCSIKGATLGVPVEIPKNTELAAYGAALAAGTALEWWPPPGQGTAGSWPHPEVDVLLPEFVPEYEEGFGRFLELGDAAEGRLSQP
jgi:xylulokinase